MLMNADATYLIPDKVSYEGRGTEGIQSRGAGQGSIPRCPDNVIADPSRRRLFRADHGPR
jgi:hypothetical protein